ncbi:MAG: aminopeptidase P N-terminal domain-containing protein [Gammaproteobacteria bacterium]|nr:aminopeptidase P N-terminal domain-containing protein [Gammaproteobacteria bacterium]
MDKMEHSHRRDRLMAAIGPRSVAIIAGANELRRNGDTHFPFRQESDFFYLTGFTEPNAVLVLTPCGNKAETTLFLNPKDQAAEQWTGRRLGVKAAPERMGIDQAFDVANMDEELPTLLKGRQSLHALFGFDSTFDQRIFSWINKLKTQRQTHPGEFINLAQTLHELRVIKSPVEQQQMQRAAEITAKAHIRAMKSCRPGLGEWSLEGELLAEFMSHGARFSAYPSIVASGENACIMHYIDNDATLEDGDLVLIDAGCELDHYASDVTRTFPVNGTFTSEQRDLYQLCLNAQKAAIEAASPKARFGDPHETARRILTQGLIDLEIIDCESVDVAIEKGSEKRFLVHRCSHWLGLDVHDVGMFEDNGKSRVLEPGMVLTVEPGIYIPTNEQMKDVDSRWQGIGVRIEDDVLITESGNRVLSQDAPKEPSDIESLMANGL